MQSIRALVAAAAASLFLTAPAHADTRIFIIDNSDGYGIDRCLASGAPCGERIAVAWCRSHDYDKAIDFGRVSESAFTPASAATSGRSAACTGPLCPEAVAITCSR